MSQDVSKKVVVRFLKNVAHYKIGQEVELDEADADAICKVNHRPDGLGGFTEVVRAMKLDDWDKLQASLKSDPNLTQADATALGVKNVVAPPEEDESKEEPKPAKGKKGK